MACATLEYCAPYKHARHILLVCWLTTCTRPCAGATLTIIKQLTEFA